MAWVNYRSVAGRFGHIDADFVRSSGELSSDGGAAELVVGFYPWWEHPNTWLPSTAARRGASRISKPGSAMLQFERSVHGRFVCLTLSRSTDWCLAETHPPLWEFAARSTIFANGPFDRSAFFDGLMALALPHVSQADLLNHIQLPDSRQAPLGLTMPAQLHQPVLTVLGRLDVPVFSPGSPATPKPAVVFLFGAYIIADDVEIDVPVFVHRPEWFRPVADQR